MLYTGVHIQRPLATQLIPNASQSFDKKRSSPYPHLTIGRIELSRESQRESRARTPSHSKALPAPTLSDSLPLRVSVYLLSARPPVQNWQDIVVDGLTMELAKRMPCHTIPDHTITYRNIQHRKVQYPTVTYSTVPRNRVELMERWVPILHPKWISHLGDRVYNVA